MTLAKSISLLGANPRPGGVTLAAVLQLLLAATFLIMPTLAYRYGADAQAAAEAEVARQGFPLRSWPATTSTSAKGRLAWHSPSRSR